MAFMDRISQLGSIISVLLAEGSSIWTLIFMTLFVVALAFFFRGIYIYSRRSVESSYFMVFCVPICVWAFLIAVGPALGLGDAPGTIGYTAVFAANTLIPAFMMFHIWSQVSYKPITAGSRAFWLIVPIALIAFVVLDLYDYLTIDFNFVLYGRASLIVFISNVYLMVVLMKSYLLCFNVLYQMPKHMRRSAYLMLYAITSILLANVITWYFTFQNYLQEVILAIVYIMALSVFHKAFFITNSSNVIVTSREFVFSNLSTIVFSISLKGNILDWNKKDKDACRPLPAPKYKEPYARYRKRILEECNATISPHDENILNIVDGDREYSFMFTWHEISFLGRKFGYLVEIAEVTKSYEKLRYIEEIAYYDTLTSLRNRNAYMEKVSELTEKEMPLLVIIGDVNNLKKTNDIRGHLYGDKLLLTITDAVRKNAPESAFVARIGGDELVLLVPNSSENDARAFIDNVTKMLNAISDTEIGTPSISWGYSMMYNISDNYNDIFRAADAIMYQEKKQAREVSISGVVPK